MSDEEMSPAKKDGAIGPVETHSNDLARPSVSPVIMRLSKDHEVFREDQ